MKKLIVLMVAALPLFAVAQTSSSMSTTKGEKVLPNFYGEILVTQQQNRDIVRIQFDPQSSRMVTDKVTRDQMQQLRTRSFSSVTEAMNVISAMGWTIGDSYEIERRDEEELHILFYKPTMMVLRAEDGRSTEGQQGTNSSSKSKKGNNGNGGVGIKQKK